MYFKRLEMQGFKSFADPVTIELNDGITCIVGPNGSGKSNISDALRWVLGEQSPKSLRGGKMDDVIFAGTTTRRPRGMAEVSLVIDNSTGILPLEYSEVQVTRRMYRSGETEYLINGNTCRLRDIRELFMDTGIGVDGYSIIGQGKIQDIVSTKAENRREIFEEAAGVVLYKSRKAEAERKLSSASDNLERVRDIIAEIEGRIGTLQNDAEKAKEYLALRERYRYLGVNIILHNVSGLERNLEGTEQELDALREQLENALAAQDTLEERIEALRLEEARLSSEYEQTNQDLRNNMEELSLMTSHGEVNQEKLQSIERELARLAVLQEEAEEKTEVERRNFAELEQKEAAYIEEKAEAERDLHKAAHALEGHEEKAKILRAEMERSREKALELSNQKISRGAEIATLENYRKTLAEQAERLNQERSGRGETDSKLRKQLADVSELLASKTAEREAASREAEQVESEIAASGRARERCLAEIEELRTQYNRRVARRNTIEEMESNYEGYQGAVRVLMQQRLAGIIDTVSNLITVPAGYELAVETALGAGMQNIVCTDDGAAKRAVHWLKEQRAGRATFLPLASIHAHIQEPESAVKGAEGYLGLASEIVDSEDRYREVVEYLLGRVILADDMHHALRLSKQMHRGFRVVTLEGEVINASGAITGGRYKNKTAGLLSRRKEIAELTSAIGETERRLDESRAQAEDYEGKVREAKEKRTDIYTRLQQLEVEQSVLASEQEHAAAEVEAAGSAAERYSSELSTVHEDMDRAARMIDEHRAAVDEADAEIARLESRTEELQAETLRYETIAAEDRETVVEARLRVGEQEARMLSLNEMIERVRDDLADLEESLETSGAERASLLREKEILASSGQEANERQEALTAKREALEEHIAELRAEREENRRTHTAALEEQKTVGLNVKELQDKRYTLQVKRTKSETLLGTQKDKLWDEFEIAYPEAQSIRDEHFAITAGNKEARDIRLRMSELGDVNVSAIEEYQTVRERYDFLSAQETDALQAMQELQGIIRNMDRTIRDTFKENFDRVVLNFEQIFEELFGGGHAELLLEDPADPLNSGIEIVAQPPGKKLKNINLMSGGEKTLTAIALMFAVLKAKPTPFCILDEVEAALDEANIERFSRYLKHFKDVQFALITHQKATMEHADILYGVTMPEQGISRVLSLKFDEDLDVEAYTE